MMRATLDRGRIVVTADAESASAAANLPGATRTPKLPPHTWHMPLTWESIDALREAQARACSELLAEARRLMETRRYIEAQKQGGDAEPLRPMPLKPGVQPFDHQVRAHNIALALFGYLQEDEAPVSSGCAYFLDMGLGKGLCSISVTGRLFLDGKIRRVLVVAPSSVCAVWPHEYQKFAGFPHKVALLLGDRDKRLATLKRLQEPVPPSAPTPLLVAVINYESTRLLEAELAAFAPDMIIADESQRIKNHSAKQSKAMHRLGDKARYKLILTGTPVTQDTRDMWSQYRFLAPATFGGSYYTFVKRYAMMGGYGQHQYLGPRNLEELTRKAHAIAYRATKAECLDLPDKLFEDRIIELEPKARALYNRIRKESFAELESGGLGRPEGGWSDGACDGAEHRAGTAACTVRSQVTASIVLTRLLRLQQLTGGFVTDDDGKTRQVSLAKLDATGDIVQSVCVDGGHKLVIFARFRAEIEALRERVDALLRPADLKQVAIWGDVALTKRGDIVERFQTDPDTRVLIGQIEACAEGITLTAAHHTLYYSQTWNLAKYLQSQDRTHRIGQDHGTLYIHLAVPSTIDTKIMQALKKKEDLAHSVVDNWRALLSEEGEHH